MEPRKCQICEKKVSAKEWEFNWIDGAVLGEYIRIRGHRKCLDNVDILVVVPNRLRLNQMRVPRKDSN
jgi:hypothetical protein